MHSVDRLLSKLKIRAEAFKKSNKLNEIVTSQLLFSALSGE